MRRHDRRLLRRVPLLFSLVLLAGIGNLGRTGDAVSGGEVRATINPTFAESVDPDEPIATVRDNLVATIDADPAFTSQSVTDPNDPTANSFSVTPATGGDVARLQLCSTDQSIDHVGVDFPGVGRKAARLGRVLQKPAGDGSYSLQLDTRRGPDCTFSFNTDPSDTAASMNLGIESELKACALEVTLDGSGLFVIGRRFDDVKALRIESSDTGLTAYCVEVTNVIPGTFLSEGDIPTLSQYGILALGLGLTLGALLVLRRQGRAVR